MGSSTSKPSQGLASRRKAAAKQKALIDFRHNMELTHYSDVDPRAGHDRNRMAWEAVLYVQARDVDRVLREGLRVSAADAGMPYPCPDDLLWRGWAHVQQYALRGDDADGWSAHLVVGARRREALARFRMEHVVGKMARARVWDGEGSLVFRHDALDAAQRQNNHHFAFLVDDSCPSERP
ncbi:hypothetical protein LX36DRAFT_572507 [Colletotrichum falcatum]|nr:hypothetical protein LX36DRAFT_572507 [Colletotrichum falcatum]